MYVECGVASVADGLPEIASATDCPEGGTDGGIEGTEGTDGGGTIGGTIGSTEGTDGGGTIDSPDGGGTIGGIEGPLGGPEGGPEGGPVCLLLVESLCGEGALECGGILAAGGGSSDGVILVGANALLGTCGLIKLSVSLVTLWVTELGDRAAGVPSDTGNDFMKSSIFQNRLV